MSAAGIAVIVPVRDGATYLGAALASALSQEPGPVEVVVVDDGSSDGSGELAARLAGVRVVSVPRLGPGAARNAGVRESRAPLLAFLDADDLFPPGRLERMARALGVPPDFDGVLGRIRTFLTPDREPELRGRYACPPEPLAGRHPGALLVTRAAFLRTAGFDETLRIGEGVDWFHRAEAAGVRFSRVDDVVLERRIHGGNLTLQSAASRVDYVRAARAAILRKGGASRP